MLSAEIAALRRIGAPADFGGGRMAFAFGYTFDGKTSEEQEYLFEISLDGSALVCVIDVYSAVGYVPAEFDVDAWDARKIIIRGPATREDFRIQASIARAVLKGFRVHLSDGTEIHVKELAQ